MLSIIERIIDCGTNNFGTTELVQGQYMELNILMEMIAECPSIYYIVNIFLSASTGQNKLWYYWVRTNKTRIENYLKYFSKLSENIVSSIRELKAQPYQNSLYITSQFINALSAAWLPCTTFSDFRMKFAFILGMNTRIKLALGIKHSFWDKNFPSVLQHFWISAFWSRRIIQFE